MKKILFETHHLYYFPNFTPIIDEFKSRNKYEIFFSMPQYMDISERTLFYDACSSFDGVVIRSEDEERRIEKIKSLNFDVIIVGNVGQLNKIVSKSTLAVMVYHGIGLKQSYYNDIDPRVDIRSVESEARYKELYSQGHENLILTGFTKLDPLFIDTNIGGDAIKVKTGINNDLPIILYAPTFYPSSFDNLFNELEFISSEFNIIIKLHNFSWFQDRYLYQSKKAIELESRSDNIYLLDKNIFDIIPYYKISDILISDISSTIFEFLPLNKPIIQVECLSMKLRHRIFKKRFMRRLDLTRMQEIDFVYKIYDPSELFRSLMFAYDHPEEMSEPRLAAHDHYLYKNDGNASKRLVNEIESRILGK